MTAADTTTPFTAADTTENKSNNDSSKVSISEGMAGRTNYRKWDKVTRELVSETEEEEQRESALESEKLGHTRVPYSKAEEEERAKAEAARKAKEALDAQKEREQAATAVLEDVLKESDDDECVISPAMLGGKRVVLLRNITGPGKIIFPPVLSQLGHTAQQDNVCVRGLIKVFIENCKDVEIVSLCKIITSTVEVTRCENLQLCIGQERLSTIQADMCSELTIEFQSAGLWGAKEDRIYHAGVSDMSLVLPNPNKSSDEPLRKSMDYVKDGAQERGNATKEEYQFVTFVDKSTKELKTESVVRIKGRMLTETERQETGSFYSENVDKATPSQQKQQSENGMDEEESKDVINQCVVHKGEGNDAFKQGEYAQAVLFYSLAIDKSEALPPYSPTDDSTNNNNKNQKTFTERHICYSNRAACFLKLGHHDKALDDANACLELCPDFIKALFRKGLALHAMKRYEEARPVLAQCLTKEPKNKQIQQAMQFCEIHLEKERRRRMMG